MLHATVPVYASSAFAPADLGKTADNFILDLVALVNWLLGGNHFVSAYLADRSHSMQAWIRRDSPAGYAGHAEFLEVLKVARHGRTCNEGRELRSAADGECPGEAHFEPAASKAAFVWTLAFVIARSRAKIRFYDRST